MNQSKWRLLIQAASLLVDQAATMAALEKSAKPSDTANLRAAFAYTDQFQRIQPHLFEMEALVQARADDNEIFWVLREILESVAAPEPH